MANRAKFISMCIGNRIRELRMKSGLTQKDLADRLYKSESAIRMWELGKSEPDLQTVNALAGIFNVTSDYILGATPMTMNIGSRVKFPLNKADNRGVRIPVYGYVAAGIPLEAIEDIQDYEEISLDMAVSGRYAALKIKGNSMLPRFAPDDVVIVRLQDDVDNGDIAIVMVNGDEATCKKIKKTPEGIMLISTNPDYEPMFYTNQEIEEKPIKIWGKVVELRAKF